MTNLPRASSPAGALRAIAFYLPQFHPVPENDEWWGKGFTEWTNVTKASPLFKWHYQPHLPSDLGFYDLRLSEVRELQAALAREYGISGFCYYHYWFHGRRMLERPFNEVLASGRPDFPFCLCWANEHWSRNWDGEFKKLLLEQTYSEEDDRNHIRWLMTAFRDKRYIRVNGRPLMIIYRTKNLPSAPRTAEIWREECRNGGIGEIYLCQVESVGGEKGAPETSGFDANIEFQPSYSELGAPLKRGKGWDLLRKLRLSDRVYHEQILFNYADIVEKMLAREKPSYKRYPCVTPSWDNCARRKRHAVILKGSTPESYEKWLSGVIRQFAPYSKEENLLFINAWNEWAEGNHLEPCQKWGHSYLKATKKALGETSGRLIQSAGRGIQQESHLNENAKTRHDVY